MRTATSPTASTARRCRRPAWAAWRRWRRCASWRRKTIARPTTRSATTRPRRSASGRAAMIRYARAADRPAIDAVITAAFGRADEARLVERLRADDDAMFELVAEQDGVVVGHILFSRLWAA